MTTLRHLRKTALSLPEVEEGTHFGMVSFAVRGKGFASVTKDGLVQLTMSEDHAAGVLERFPAAERLTRQGKPLGVRVPLDAVNGMELNALVEKSWLSRAPKRLAATRLEARSATAPEGADALPKAIGKPATRALLAAGIRDLHDVAARSENELLDLHGVGPKATKVLGDALAERGLAFKP
ncbi:MAG TPA: MmcQ/YjbR family DNA-binding protein [Trueperaceae bacterium]